MSRRRTGRTNPGRSGSGDERKPSFRLKSRRSKVHSHQYTDVDTYLTNATRFSKTHGGTGTSFTTTGIHTYEVPRGVDTLRIHLYGAGGGGARATSGLGSFMRGGGGGGGAVVGITLSELSPGAVLTFMVGTGGTAGNALDWDAPNVAKGLDTWFNYSGVTFAAHGGEPGSDTRDKSDGGLLEPKGRGGTGAVLGASGSIDVSYVIVHGATGRANLTNGNGDGGSGGGMYLHNVLFGSGGSGGSSAANEPGMTGSHGAVVIS